VSTRPVTGFILLISLKISDTKFETLSEFLPRKAYSARLTKKKWPPNFHPVSDAPDGLVADEVFI
jgi:hypothetical protein